MAPAADQSVHGNADEIIPSLIDRGNDSSDISGNFDCSICLDESQAPVVTMCGHLFCWPCIHQWITIHSALEQCPVCKACIKDKIIPLYGRGKTDFTSPGLEKVHRSGRPRVTSLYNQHMNPSADLSGLQNAGFQYVGQQSYGFVAQENYGPQGAYFTSSAITFGLFPALFGVYGSTVTHQNGGRPSRSSSSSLAMRGRAIDTFLFQRVQPDREHRFILCGFLVLLAGFAISCLLLF